MKVSELRTCAGCKGPVLLPGATSFRVLMAMTAAATPVAYRIAHEAVANGGNLEAAEAADPDACAAIVFGPVTTILLCPKCQDGPVSLFTIESHVPTLAPLSAGKES